MTEKKALNQAGARHVHFHEPSKQGRGRGRGYLGLGGHVVPRVAEGDVAGVGGHHEDSRVAPQELVPGSPPAPWGATPGMGRLARRERRCAI